MLPLSALTFPNFDPVAFSIGPVDLRWYGLAYAAGLLLGWIVLRRLLARPSLWNGRVPLTADAADTLLLWVTIGVVIGGRLGFIMLYEPGYFIAHPWEVFAVWHGGMAFHGGVIGVMVALWLFSRFHKVRLFSIADGVCAVVPIGLFFGRLANFINGEVFGRPSDVPWAMAFPEGGAATRHPSQLYEAALEGLLLFALIWWLIHHRQALARPGLIAGVFLAGYALARMVCELFRDPDPNAWFDLGFLTTGMVYSLPMLVLGYWLIRRARTGTAAASGTA